MESRADDVADLDARRRCRKVELNRSTHLVRRTAPTPAPDAVVGPDPAVLSRCQANGLPSWEALGGSLRGGWPHAFGAPLGLATSRSSCVGSPYLRRSFAPLAGARTH